jgi:hypothetical protein
MEYTLGKQIRPLDQNHTLLRKLQTHTGRRRPNTIHRRPAVETSLEHSMELCPAISSEYTLPIENPTPEITHRLGQRGRSAQQDT